VRNQLLIVVRHCWLQCSSQLQPVLSPLTLVMLEDSEDNNRRVVDVFIFHVPPIVAGWAVMTASTSCNIVTISSFTLITVLDTASNSVYSASCVRPPLYLYHAFNCVVQWELGSLLALVISVCSCVNRVLMY
jgi:hypothetical protein